MTFGAATVILHPHLAGLFASAGTVFPLQSQAEIALNLSPHFLLLMLYVLLLCVTNMHHISIQQILNY